MLPSLRVLKPLGTCTMYIFITCSDTGTLLGLLNIAIIFSVCVCVIANVYATACF